MDKYSRKEIEEKVVSVEEFTISKEILLDTIKKRKNWSASGIDGGPKLYCNKFRGIWNSFVKCFTKWIEEPNEIFDWLT